MLSSNGIHQQYPETMDVIISVGFVRGIIMKEQAKRGKEWKTFSDLDAVKVVITAVVPATGFQSETLLTSGPLEDPKKIGDLMKYSAIFPLKGKEKNAGPTRIIMPGLLQQDKTSDDPSSRYKRQTVELLITLVLGNEAFTLGRATLLVTGEEVKTKQSDLPIDTNKSTVLKLQKKSAFPMKRTNSISSNKKGYIAPTSFKFDRRRRKFHIEEDAVLRAYMKVTPSDPYAQAPNGGGGMVASMLQRNGSTRAPSVGRSQNSLPKNQHGIPRVITPNMGFQPSLESTSSIGGYSSSRRSPSPMREHRDPSGRFHNRSLSNPRPQYQQRIPSNGSAYAGSAAPGRTPHPGHMSMSSRSRSQSVPRQQTGYGSHGSAYGGSSYSGAGNGYTGSRGRTPSRTGSQSGHQQYGGSSYGVPRKPHNNQGSQYGGSSFHRAGASQHSRSPSPHVRQYT